MGTWHHGRRPARTGLIAAVILCAWLVQCAPASASEPVIVPGYDAALPSGVAFTRSTASTGSIRVAVVVVRPRSANRILTVDRTRALVFGAVDSVRAQYQQMSFGRATLTGTVLGTWPVSWKTSKCAWCVQQAVKDTARRKGISLGGYERILVVIDNGSGYGLAMLGGRWAWVWSCTCSGDGAARRTDHRYSLVHELGHTLGLAHAHSRQCTNTDGLPQVFGSVCITNEYGDQYDPMGVAKGANYSASNRRFLGWLPSTRVKVAAADGAFSITSASDSSDGFKLLRIPLRDSVTGTLTRYMEVETRQRTGFDGTVSGPNSGIFPLAQTPGVLVRIVTTAKAGTMLVDMTPETNASDLPMVPGRTITDPDSGVSLVLDSELAGAAQLTVDFP